MERKQAEDHHREVPQALAFGVKPTQGCVRGTSGSPRLGWTQVASDGTRLTSWFPSEGGKEERQLRFDLHLPQMSRSNLRPIRNHMFLSVCVCV